MGSATLLGLDDSLRILHSYDVLGAADWRLRDDVRFLPAGDREDLELWLLEHAFRYCRALAERPDSPADWQRALDILHRVAAARSIQAFALLDGRIKARLTAKNRAFESESATGARAPAWLDEYLLGIAAECELEPGAQGS